MSQPVNPGQGGHPLPDDLIQYPCDFPIKVMGPNTDEFVDLVLALARTHDPVFDPGTRVQRRPSSSGNYLGLTLMVTATSRVQLDNLYRALSGHPMVKYVL